VGRYTSPDTMVRVIRQGIMDMIGAARPSIADPYLPKKIEEGRLEDIRECIGCNICVTHDFTKTPLRCTQNPSMGEEWRRGWHPEKIRPKAEDKHILVIGAGPAGLEAARALGQRGLQVTVADRASEAGDRVARECRLPGLSAWGRVRDWRMLQINKMPNVSFYLESEMTPQAVAELGADHVLLATGSEWLRDGTGRHFVNPSPMVEAADVLTPDDIMAGRRPKSRTVVLYDDDHYYMGGVLAELLVREDHAVTLVTPAAVASAYTKASLEQKAIQARLMNLGVRIIANSALSSIAHDHVTLDCVYTGVASHLEAGSTLLVTARRPVDGLWHALQAQGHESSRAGDCYGPGTIAAAVHSGRNFAENYGSPPPDFLDIPFLREVTALS
jgi:dimethylamine/trimethylamine dehydrogenase